MKRRLLVAMTLAVMLACAAQAGETVKAQLARETAEGCAAEKFAVVEQYDPPDSNWVHRVYCTEIAVVLANRYVAEHPDVVKGR